MACLEQWCVDCGHSEFNNGPRWIVCPECGSFEVRFQRDEEHHD